MLHSLTSVARFMLVPPRPFATASDETAFRTDYLQAGTPFALAALGAGALFGLSSLLLGWLWPSGPLTDPAPMILLTLLGMACTAGLAALLLRPDNRVRWHRLAVFLPALAALGALSLLLVLPDIHRPVDQVASQPSAILLLTIWLVAAFCRMMLPEILLLSVFASTICLVGLHHLGNVLFPHLLLGVIVVNLTVWALSVQIEKRERLIWWQSRQARHAVRRLRRSHERAHDLNRSQARLLSTVGHDIRQPLISCAYYLGGMIGLPGPLPALAQHRLASANACLRNIEATVERLLETSHPYETDGELETAEVDMRAMLDDLMTVFEPHARRLGVALQLRQPGGGPVIARTHATAMTEAIGNLLSNALEYTAINGAVRPRVLLALQVIDESIKVTVADNGIGIEPALHRQVFDEHYRVPASAGLVSGSGLGLAIVAGTMQRLDEHHLSLRSAPGQGTRVRLYLPFAR